ncbi:A-kinase anchor protein 14 [Geodia barretti]|uniref:A-kinase anchor protein 14 n=1 Tax=Geodia barretti TaxID=519541 RepID=A0AA35X1N6_GEOBA|nr:A-kinase anchor protein 14 [Geodia barretti]
MRKTFSPWQPINKMAADEVCSVAAELVQLAISQSVEELTENKSSTSNVSWPSSGEFTVEGGQRAVEKTVQEWKLSESWKHCIDYLGTTPGGVMLGRRERGVDELHCYRVQWSEPTRCKPVPTTTASVYFFIYCQQGTQQSKHQSQVQVFYVLEGQRLVHRPERSCFQEIWLRNIIQHKLSVVVTTTPGWAPNRTTDTIT